MIFGHYFCAKEVIKSFWGGEGESLGYLDPCDYNKSEARYLLYGLDVSPRRKQKNPWDLKKKIKQGKKSETHKVALCL